MKKILILATLALGGCQSTQATLVSTQYRAVSVPPQMFQCPVLKDYPDPKTLTDLQVARLVLELHKNNAICKASLDTIKAYLDAAMSRIGTKS